ncbi:MAG: LysM peptidoglycan-binding domain-containing protein [Acutalibacteraceae bacterium]
MINPCIRFSGYEFPYNPEKLKINGSSLYTELSQKEEKGALLNKGMLSRKISGNGCFTGGNCIESYIRLAAFLNESDAGILSISGIAPIFARLTKLELTVPPRVDCVEYEFVFTEDLSAYNTEYEAEVYHTVKTGENLWSIANIYKTTADRIYALNPQIKIVNEISAGERLRVK